jgi:hypothetical protein
MSLRKVVKTWLGWSSEPEIGNGTVADLPELLDRFLRARGSFLIIEVPGSEPACVQFAEGTDNTILIEYPLFTPEQAGRESAVRSAFSAVNLVCRETEEPGGRLLHANMPREVSAAAIKVTRILECAFGVHAASQLRFVGGNGLTIALSRTGGQSG